MKETLIPLAPSALRQCCDPAGFAFETTDDLPDLHEIIGQERAFDAVRFGVGIRRDGYNLFVLGPGGLGKHTFVHDFLTRRAGEEERPPDWCYLNNFPQPHRPRAIKLPSGTGVKLRQDMEQLVEELRAVVPAAFESDEYRARLGEIDVAFKERQQAAFKELEAAAGKQGVALLQTPGGFAFGPVKDGEVIAPEDYEKLPAKEKSRIEAVVSALQEQLQKIIHQIPLWRRERRGKLKALDQEIGKGAIAHAMDAIRAQYAAFPELTAYLDAVRQDVINHLDSFRKPEEGPSAMAGLPAAGFSFFQRYRINVLVEHPEKEGAPVIYADHPSYGNLVGRVEHVAQLGALVTDFTLIKPGALHLANGGYLLLDAYQLLTQPMAWEGLKRILRAGEIRIESLGQLMSLTSTVSLEPEPVALETKVVLFGERRLYYLLCEYDPDFPKLFKVVADFEEDVARSDATQQDYARLIATQARKEGMLPFDRGAVARVIEHGIRLAGDTEKLSTRLRNVTDLLREADYWARQAARPVVSGDHVKQAVAAQIRRVDRLREKLLEEVLHGTILIDIDGARAGQVNGLSVVDLGHYAFGHPTRITATTRVGEGEVIDIEREVDMGGPIHSKGVMILSAFLAQRYSRDRQLSLSASLVFEQTYGGVEGDSASAAELCALLSSLANAPIKQSLAMTGSVNQYGQVQAIGGANEKIEGFFGLCKEQGLTGEQGVLIPAANIRHLMLRDDIVVAAAAGQFHLYAMETIDEAIQLLTGVPAGVADDDGCFPPDTLNGRVSAKLRAFTHIRHPHLDEEKPAARRRHYGAKRHTGD